MIEDESIFVLRKYFSPDHSIAHWEWYPDGMPNAIKVDIDGISLSFCLHGKYKHTTEWGAIPEISEQTNQWITTYILYIQFQCSKEQKDQIIHGRMPDNLETRLASAVREFLVSYLDIVRNEFGQYYVSNPHWLRSISDKQVLVNLEYKESDNTWKPLPCGEIRFDQIIPHKMLHVTKERWHAMGAFIEKRHKSDLAKVFYRNAQQYFHEGELRVAIIEACIALERVISVYLRDVRPDLKTDEVKRVLSGHSLMDKVTQILPVLLDGSLKSVRTIEDCAMAVGKRNLVVHKSCVNLEREEVAKLIGSIGFAVLKLSPVLDFENPL